MSPNQHISSTKKSIWSKRGGKFTNQRMREGIAVNYKYRGIAFTSFPLSVNESKREYTEAAAILRGKNVQRVMVGIAFLVAGVFW